MAVEQIGINNNNNVYRAYNSTAIPMYSNANYLTPLQRDTLTFQGTPNAENKPKQGLSTLSKVGIGLGALALVGTCIALISKGKVSEAKKLAEHIEFTPAKTIEEARAFATNNLGVKLKFDNVELANYVNEGLVSINNATKGKSVMPSSVIVDNIDCMAWRTPTNGGSPILVLSEKIHLKGAELAKTKGISFKDFYTQALEKDRRFAGKGFSPFKEIFHELGHANHQATCSNYDKMVKLKDLTARGISDKHFTEEFIAETKDNKVIKDFFNSLGYVKKDGSIYSLESPCEYVADVFSLKVQGKCIPAEVQRIYTKYGGPEICC